MKPLDFCYWLQGFFEISGKGVTIGGSDLTAAQVMMIRKHLELVFTNVTKSDNVMDKLTPITDEEAKKIEEHAKKLAEILGRKKTDKSIFDFDWPPFDTPPFDYKRQIAIC